MKRHPNLLFIVADQFRAMCLEPGGDPVSTPFLDALAADGVSLAHAVSNYPVCSPHRAMMMSGQYPEANGVTHNVNSETAEWGVGLRPDAPSWAAVLRDAGYATGYIGKWHLEAPVPADAVHGAGVLEDGRYWDAYSPAERRHGFDFWYSYGCCDEHLTPHYWTGDAGRHERINVTGWSAAHETDIAMEFLERAAGPSSEGIPFALAVSWNPPHQPFHQLPAGHDAGYADVPAQVLLNRPNVNLASAAGSEAAAIAPLYYAAVNAIDAQLGRLLASLDTLGLARDTVVVFTSDHGQQMGSHDLLYKNVPYEESMRIPFVLRWPGRLEASATTGLSSVDIAPTILGLLGFADSVPGQMDGIDVSASLLANSAGDTGGAGAPSALYFYYPRDGRDVDVRGLRTATSKFIARLHPDGGLTTELFDLAADPFELHPVTEPAGVRHHAAALLAALTEAGQHWRGMPALEALKTGDAAFLKK
ncbi:sulfatase family protein [Arthrobacter sp. ERGS1:01]|uniref:sulfatase family protein n=1 Tax=Arthrobacter sp. ERGS1:01 TaxID=1704044 RepID=UPI0006B532F4|nr:sulfatase [Arthrobacter sp. ERGS1:01]